MERFPGLQSGEQEPNSCSVLEAASRPPESCVCVCMPVLRAPEGARPGPWAEGLP